MTNIGQLLFKTISGYLDGISNILSKINLYYLQQSMPTQLDWFRCTHLSREEAVGKVLLDVAQLWRQKAVHLRKVRFSAFKVVPFSNSPLQLFFPDLYYSIIIAIQVSLSQLLLSELLLCYFYQSIFCEYLGNNFLCITYLR